MTTDTVIRENRMRREAIRYGLELGKSARRNPNAPDYGLYALFDPETGGTINPLLLGRYTCSWTLEDVEHYLMSDVPGDPAQDADNTQGGAP
jgi:hypothetical protein